MKNKTLFRLLLIVIIFILILCIILINIKNKQKNEETEKAPQKEQEVIIPLDENVIIPKNSYLFFGKYVKGEVESQDIYNTIYYFANTIIPKYYTDLKGKDEKQVVEYYEKNKEDIHKLMEFENKEEFVKFIKEINAMNEEKITLKQIEFLENKIVPHKDYTLAELKFEYNSSLNFKIKVYKKVQKLNRNIIFYYE